MKTKTKINPTSISKNGQPQPRKRRAGDRFRPVPLVDMKYLETHDPKDIAAEFHSRMLATKKISVRVPRQLAVALHSAAKKNGMSRAAFINKAVREKIRAAAEMEPS